MLINFIDRTIGWNPQLLRELKGRLKPRNVIIAVALSALFQIGFLASVTSMLPGAYSPMDLRISTLPDLGLDYGYESNAPSEFGYINHIGQLEPIEAKAAYPDFAQYQGILRPGDRIQAVDDVLLGDAVNQPNYQTLIQGQFAEVLKSSQESERATLRTDVPGTTVKLTIEKSDGRVLDVELPRLVTSSVHNQYCRELDFYPEISPTTTSPYYASQPCQLDLGTDDYAVEWQDWFQEAFWLLSAWITFPLLTLGCFWLIGDLDQEEKRGTLNFVRLSPQSAWTILSGKILGVPSPLYLAIGLVLPTHFLLGLGGNLSSTRILGFDLLLGLSCLLFYSAALLFGTVCRGLGGFQAWLGGGLALLAQVFMFQMRYAHSSQNTVTHWIPLFSPLTYWHGLAGSDVGFLNSLNWYGMSGSVGAIAAFMVLNYGVWSGWIWRSLRRRFYTPNATLISKQESYWLTLCFQGMLLGFVWKLPTFSGDSFNGAQNWASDNLLGIVWFDFVFLCLLLVALTPQRQPLHDWARYRHLGLEGRKNRSLWYDLIWGKDSPALVAIALNGLMLLLLTMLWLLRTEIVGPEYALMSLLSSTSLVLIYAAVTQLILFTSWQRRAVIAFGAVAGLFALPSLLISILGFSSSGVLFMLFPWTMWDMPSSLATLLAMLTAQATCIGLLSKMLARRLRKAGESSSKELFEGTRPTLAGRETL
ncbi:MAG: hypothetical protein ACFB8W_09325 [Elainellaceae cyanobacterium]